MVLMSLCMMVMMMSFLVLLCVVRFLVKIFRFGLNCLVVSVVR